MCPDGNNNKGEDNRPKTLNDKNQITHKLFTYKSYIYIHLNVCKQMTDVSHFITSEI